MALTQSLAVILQSKLAKLNSFKNRYMSANNTEIKQELDQEINQQTNQETANQEINQENADQKNADQETAQAVVELSVEEKLAQDLAQEKDKFLRLFAEFENYKKRTSKERLDLFKTAGQEILQAMLPVMDDFDRAWIEISKSQEESLVKGVQLIHEKLKSTLFSKGLEAVEIQSGDVFNADFAEAITQIPAGDDLKGKVVDVIEKGYKLGDKIIRFPKVVIGN